MPPDPEPSSPTQTPNASSSRLPDYHVLGSLTDVEPGTIPLLFRMPDGNCEQVDVPLRSTVDDIASSLQKDSNDVYRLSFGNSDLDPTASLLDTNIVDAYEHAGSLLHLIATGRQDPDTKAAALDSACAVVKTISNGIKGMEALCAAAMPDASDPPRNPDSSPDDPNQSSDATPSQLAYKLSRRLPNLFPVGGPTSNEYTEQPSLGRQITAQPSISSIRDARRRASALRKAHEDESAPEPQPQLSDIAIGESTNVPLQLNLEQPSSPNVREPNTPLQLANSGKSTWLEDVMKTWEVDAVRDSGVLEKSKDGQEISKYLQSLEQEAERDAEVYKVENESPSAQKDTTTALGDSSDDEQLSTEQEGITTTQKPNSSRDPIPNGQLSPPNGDSELSSVTEDLQRSIAAVNISDHTGSDPATQMLAARNAASAAVMEGSTADPLLKQSIRSAQQRSPQHGIQPPFEPNKPGQNLSQSVAPVSAAHTLPKSHEHQAPMQSGNHCDATPETLSTSSEGATRSGDISPAPPRDMKSKPPLRQATKIAPAPSIATSPLPGANGLFPNQVYPGVMPVPGVTWQSKPVVSGQKKRGRKRKNPELTDEERALARKQQNRESAKLSRVRRKVIAAEYEGRLNALIEENTMLRKQVEGLNNRLVYLQSLLTISVRQEAHPP